MLQRMTPIYPLCLILILGCSTHTRPFVQQAPAHHRSLAISTSEPLATQAAAEVFEKGGNIVDAAIAASFALSVVRPQSTGIGGGGFLLFYESKTKRTYAFDFRETAPLKASPQMFLKDGEVIPDASSTGALSVGVPGMIEGLYQVHGKFGKLPWASLISSSIQLAESRISVSKHMARALREEAEHLRNSEDARRIFFQGDRPLQEGETFTQPELAQTLRGIAERGSSYFYQGAFAQKLADWMRQNGGLIGLEDLAKYKVNTPRPLQAPWSSYEIITFPPPSSGGIHLLQILQIFDAISSKYKSEYGKEGAEIESMKRAFADRAFWLGDPAFTIVPVRHLLDRRYMQARAKEIDSQVSTKAEDIRPWSREQLNHETTHISLIDEDGNAISTTQSINGYFGAKVIVPGTGVILNNTMDDFSLKPGAANQFGLIGGKKNRIQGGKRPLSSMTPTIVLNSKQNVELVIGAPGGSRIITAVYQVLSRILRDGVSAESALKSCRFHHQWSPDKVLVEPPCLKLCESLKAHYKCEVPSSVFGEVQIVGRTPSGDLYSAVDPRGHGEAIIWTSDP